MEDNTKDTNISTGINLNLDSKDFIKLNPEVQGHVINQIAKNNEGKSGMFERIFGYTKDVASIYVAFVLCVLTLIVCIFMKNGEYLDKGISLMTLFIGYIFGVRDKN